MKPPKSAALFETPVSTLWFDESGILCYVSNNKERTIENYRPLIELYKKLSEEKGAKICLLADSTKSASITKEAQEYLNVELPKYLKAIAVISRSPFGKMIGDLFGIIRTPYKHFKYHFRVFNSEEKAKKWLKLYL